MGRTATKKISGAHKPPTPLAIYVEQAGVKLVALGLRMAESEGVTPPSASLSHWNLGVCAPNARWQLAMEKATDGAVTPRAWSLWRAETAAKKSRRRGRAA